MAAVRKRQLEILRPYIAAGAPHQGRNGREIDLVCPLHDDNKRSASLNIDTGEWWCHGCGEGGRVASLLKRRDEWLAPNGSSGSNGYHATGKPAEVITEAKVQGWQASLMSAPAELEELMAARSLNLEIIEAFEVGWDRDKSAYTIPVRDPEGELWNIRRYQINPPKGRRKIWGVTGMNTPRLYPISTIVDDDPEEIIICEGEWDAIITLQYGFHAITRTAAADVWDAEWGRWFKGRNVYLCHDRDRKGESANRKIAKLLKPVAASVKVIELPYKLTEKHGKDLTDYWQDGHTAQDFQELLDNAVFADAADEAAELDPSDASVLDSFDSRNVGQPLKLTVTVKGKRDPGYSVPAKAKLTCTRDAGAKCKICPMNAAGGEADLNIAPNNPIVLELMESSKAQVHEIMRREYGAVKCNRLNIDVTKHQSVEVLYARPSVEHTNGDGAAAYKNVKLTSVGRHDTLPNNTVQVVGALHPDPRKQLNEFLAWELNPVTTSLDQFELNSAILKKLERFRPRKGQSPLDRLMQIANDLEQHVTKIYGRPEMHAAMDLVWHSALAFDFGGQRVERGWIELLVAGDTRTGKSEAATQLARHYRAGEVVSCESASFAGIVGGLQQYGSGKEWSINWGVVPLNDRRLVVLDEVSGLSPEEIASMSDVRSRGVAQLTKIQQEATHARTRLVWLGNPRDGGMSQYTYGVQALKPLIGNPEDIARFDIAMSVHAGEVEAGKINAEHEPGRQKFTSEACSALVRWVWSRTPDQVKWGKGTEQAVLAAAQELGRRYVEDPPLIQAANARIKIARVAVAIAARLFSTDAEHEKISVRKEHVQAAVEFIDRLYGMHGFGYSELSTEIIADRQEARAKRDDIRKWLRSRPGVSKFLRGNSTFRRQDLEEILNVSREEANGIINTLWEARMVSKNKGDVRVEPTLHELLRDVRH